MCGAVHDEPLGHIPAPYSGYAPTCTASGATNGEICTRCGDVVTPRRTISATGHSFNAWEPLPGGLHTAVCSTSSCGASGVLPCSCFSAELNGAEVSVCPICGRCGD